jgi:signal transduction histidine kinase/CheY-like chemotaxis protein
VAVSAFSWNDASRELLLACNADGTITWADDRALRMLGDVVGRPLIDLAIPGSEDKLKRLFEAAAVSQAETASEVALRAANAAVTVVFSGRPAPDASGVQLLGSVLPDGYSATVRTLGESMAEVVSLNREIGRQKKQLSARNLELETAYRNLDESSRAVVSLHAEIADRADTLRRSNDVKSRVVANLSHELRTPLHAILGLARILLADTDGPLSSEQRKQVTFIQTSADQLAQLVNDLLDLAKTEAGKLQLRPVSFTVDELFSTFRGTIRPLLPPDSPVEIDVTAPPEPIHLNTDQGKLSQILRNLVSNALKFTEEGAVKVGARADGDMVVFSVQDTGIGIAPEHFERIFEEFGQIDSEVQRRVKGTGLGLPLSRKLAEVLGGTLTMQSTPGEGSTFTLTIPAVHLEVSEIAKLEQRPLDPAKAPVLVVEDDRKTIFVYEKYLSMAGFQVLPARTIDDARRLVRSRPSAIVLDIMLENETSWEFLAELKSNPETREIPVLVVTVTSRAQKARALGADEFWLKPVDKDRLIRKLRSVTKPSRPARLLLIDDDESSRYLIRKLLDDTDYELHEASTGPAGVEAAQAERPDVILLDFLLQEMTAFDVLDELKADPRTRSIPVVIVTSHLLGAHDRRRLSAESEAILSKNNLSRELAINRIRDALRKSTLEGGGAVD